MSEKKIAITNSRLYLCLVYFLCGECMYSSGALSPGSPECVHVQQNSA